ncbi:GtrA family protein [Streptomyces sp. WMMB 322]|uniref:GtrA family protein n=1 Tax=Streptomyces sp. WMMB 322 TaxID=1286821 RepID=UPI000823C829|nr:GtrA family protein [Streptomyces sp. WMMB 322]SCK30736.1 Putative flippase GtrA (transmembrane translocase of bactoprenol-linked glucose) [Streptomyces sp. WMMB 322]
MPEGKTPGAKRPRIPALANEIAKFAVVGGFGVAVNFAVFNLCRTATQLTVEKCSFAGTSAAIFANYLGFRYYTYRDRQRRGHAREFSFFVLFSVVGLAIENGVLYSATNWFGWNSGLQSNLFKGLGIAVATCFRFCSYRTWVFRARTDTVGSRAGSPADG